MVHSVTNITTDELFDNSPDKVLTPLSLPGYGCTHARARRSYVVSVLYESQMNVYRYHTRRVPTLPGVVQPFGVSFQIADIPVAHFPGVSASHVAAESYYQWAACHNRSTQNWMQTPCCSLQTSWFALFHTKFTTKLTTKQPNYSTTLQCLHVWCVYIEYAITGFCSNAVCNLIATIKNIRCFQLKISDIYRIYIADIYNRYRPMFWKISFICRVLNSNYNDLGLIDWSIDWLTASGRCEKEEEEIYLPRTITI